MGRRERKGFFCCFFLITCLDFLAQGAGLAPTHSCSWSYNRLLPDNQSTAAEPTEKARGSLTVFLRPRDTWGMGCAGLCSRFSVSDAASLHGGRCALPGRGSHLQAANFPSPRRLLPLQQGLLPAHFTVTRISGVGTALAPGDPLLSSLTPEAPSQESKHPSWPTTRSAFVSLF